MTNLLIVGPPGAGKGTQASLLASRNGLVHLSTGDMLRKQASNLTALGLEAKAYMDAGEYVPDELTSRMLGERIAGLDANDGLILDGFPRTLAQVRLLDGLLEDLQRRLDLVVVLHVPIDVAVQRASVRAGVEGRVDDDAAVVRRRHEVYADQTAPLVDLYRARGMVRDIDGTRTPENVAASIAQHVAATAASQEAPPAAVTALSQ